MPRNPRITALLNRGKRRSKNKLVRLRGPCYLTDCKRRGAMKHECRVCLDLALKDKIKNEDVFTVQFCDIHTESAESKIKRHVLSKHKGIAMLTAFKVGYTST